MLVKGGLYQLSCLSARLPLLSMAFPVSTLEPCLVHCSMNVKQHTNEPGVEFSKRKLREDLQNVAFEEDLEAGTGFVSKAGKDPCSQN